MKDLSELILVLGGSSSGKSGFAEGFAKTTQNNYYLATMERLDIRSEYCNEAENRINRHRKNREGKDFITLEIERDIEDRIDEAFGGTADLILLESLSTLLSNEMFRDETIIDGKECENKIMRAVKALLNKTRCLVIVSDEIFSDGIIYEEPTKSYLRCLSALHIEIAREAATVYEVYYGFPRRLK